MREPDCNTCDTLATFDALAAPSLAGNAVVDDARLARPLPAWLRERIGAGVGVPVALRGHNEFCGNGADP